MATARVRLSHFDKTLLTESGASRSSNWANFRQILWGHKLISEYFKSKF